jgi:hypothetical protein
MVANIRKTKNHILVLMNGSTVATSKQDKHQMIFDHYHNNIGSFVTRRHVFNYGELGWQAHQLQHLDLPFTESEVERTLKSMPEEKALDQTVSLEPFSEIVEKL